MEFGLESEAVEEETETEPSSKLIEEYQLSQLKPPSSYVECQNVLRLNDDKIQYALSSLPHARYKITIQSMNIFLARDTLQKIKDKSRKEAGDKLQKVNRAITLAENKAKK